MIRGGFNLTFHKFKVFSALWIAEYSSLLMVLINNVRWFQVSGTHVTGNTVVTVHYSIDPIWEAMSHIIHIRKLSCILHGILLQLVRHDHIGSLLASTLSSPGCALCSGCLASLFLIDHQDAWWTTTIACLPLGVRLLVVNHTSLEVVEILWCFKYIHVIYHTSLLVHLFQVLHAWWIWISLKLFQSVRQGCCDLASIVGRGVYSLIGRLLVLTLVRHEQLQDLVLHIAWGSWLLLLNDGVHVLFR